MCVRAHTGCDPASTRRVALGRVRRGSAQRRAWVGRLAMHAHMCWCACLWLCLCGGHVWSCAHTRVHVVCVCVHSSPVLPSVQKNPKDVGWHGGGLLLGTAPRQSGSAERPLPRHRARRFLCGTKSRLGRAGAVPPGRALALTHLPEATGPRGKLRRIIAERIHTAIIRTDASSSFRWALSRPWGGGGGVAAEPEAAWTRGSGVGMGPVTAPTLLGPMGCPHRPTRAHR